MMGAGARKDTFLSIPCRLPDRAVPLPLGPFQLTPLHQSMITKADLSVADRVELLKSLCFHTHVSGEERERLDSQKYVSQVCQPRVCRHSPWAGLGLGPGLGLRAASPGGSCRIRYGTWRAPP